MTYTILTKEHQTDGSIINNIRYNLNGQMVSQQVFHASGSQLSDIITGVENMGIVLNRNLVNIANAPSVLDSIVLNEETEF